MEELHLSVEVLYVHCSLAEPNRNSHSHALARTLPISQYLTLAY